MGKSRLGRAERAIVRDYHMRIRSLREAAIAKNLSQPKPHKGITAYGLNNKPVFLGFRSAADKLGNASPRFRDPWNTRRPERPGSTRIADGSFACIIKK